MFIILSLISYYVFENQPPVIYAYNGGKDIDSSLLDIFNKEKNVIIIRPNNPSIPLRISQFNGFPCDNINKSQVYVFPNSTDLETIYALNSTQLPVKEILVNISDSDYGAVCDVLGQHANEFIIVTEHYPEFKKVGYSNPFTSGVWNCFFFIIFTISFVIWSMIHYANIDVQTRFAKKLY